ncbi:MAG TPA: hypothetical protein VGR11_08340, partial [Solirubrobacteraceae bacterium]|nr:hypothetical protein [Solirubrobacteraceae bacterium]
MTHILAIVIAVVVSLLVLFAAAVLVIDATSEDVIADGVQIADVDVGGLDREAARERVQSELDGEVAKPVKATYGDSTFTLTPETAQAGIDVDATVDAA